ncbi:MAG TPA: DUF3224 domain-containing protein [Xanthomonadaceae bacterium]|jgi:hypothetical protein
MQMRAQGRFDVKLVPMAADHESGAAIGRMTIDKRFHGDLEASSRGQMLAHRTAVQGSAGYVAMEIVTGALGGRSGSFVFQHSGTMDRGEATLVLTVVPDSATGDLAGLRGSMAIVIAGGDHSYMFDYALG